MLLSSPLLVPPTSLQVAKQMFDVLIGLPSLIEMEIDIEIENDLYETVLISFRHKNKCVMDSKNRSCLNFLSPRSYV